MKRECLWSIALNVCVPAPRNFPRAGLREGGWMDTFLSRKISTGRFPIHQRKTIESISVREKMPRSATKMKFSLSDCSFPSAQRTEGICQGNHVKPYLHMGKNSTKYSVIDNGTNMGFLRLEIERMGLRRLVHNVVFFSIH